MMEEVARGVGRILEVGEAIEDTFENKHCLCLGRSIKAISSEEQRNK